MSGDSCAVANERELLLPQDGMDLRYLVYPLRGGS
jgi:hypothetical protein